VINFNGGIKMLEGIEIIKVLGNQKKRKFGTVYLAKQIATNELVCVKQVQETVNNSRAIEQLKNECLFNFTLNGLPQIIDFKEGENSNYLVKKYVEGIPLKEYWSHLKKRNRLTFLQNFMREITPIFNYLLEHNIVHNDIKPSNFIINEVNGKLSVSLIDFGLAIHKEDNITRKTLFPLGFASPELLLNQLNLVDQRSDIFALGISIWNLYTNRLPFYHSNPSVYTNLQVTYPLPKASEIQQDLFEIIEKCCVKYNFKTAPNLLPLAVVQQHLIEAINLRFDSVLEIKEAIEQLSERKTVLQRLVQVFSKTNIKSKKQ
jgi:serine/threonine protein kinase